MNDLGYSLVTPGVEGKYFLAIYKDISNEGCFNICFVNNSEAVIENLKSEAMEVCSSKTSESNEVVALLKREFVNIPSGEYLLLEKIDPEDPRVDAYRYEFTIKIDCETVSVSCSFKKSEFYHMTSEIDIPIINEAGLIYLCA